MDENSKKTLKENATLKFEKNVLESKISKMKFDIDKALQKCQSAEQMKAVIIDMCIQYLWND